MGSAPVAVDSTTMLKSITKYPVIPVSGSVKYASRANDVLCPDSAVSLTIIVNVPDEAWFFSIVAEAGAERLNHVGMEPEDGNGVIT